MTDQPDEGSQSSTPADPTSPLDFDPYRYGKPDHPVPPEYAPPGYVPPTPAAPGPPPGQPTGQQPVWPPTEAKQPPPQYGAYPGYGYTPHPPPPPGYPAYGMVQQSNGKATTAMVLGILSIVFFWLTFLDLGLAIPAIILGAIGMRDAKRYPPRGGRGKALAGIICGGIGAVLIIITLVVVLVRISPCIHSGGGVSQSCVNDHL